MFKKMCLIVSIVLLSACGTMKFAPTEYPLRDGLISKFSVSGDFSIINAQPSKEPTIVYSYMGTKLSSDLNSITEVMVQQTIKELNKHGQKVGGNSSKKIEIKVNSLISQYTNLFFWKSKLNFQAYLGNGEVIEMTVPHASGVLEQDLNGCIAESVMSLLNNEKVKVYLAGNT